MSIIILLGIIAVIMGDIQHNGLITFSTAQKHNEQKIEDNGPVPMSSKKRTAPGISWQFEQCFNASNMPQ